MSRPDATKPRGRTPLEIAAGQRGRLEFHATGEAHATAAAASLVVRALLGEQSIAPGVWLPDRAISASWFLSELSRLGFAMSGDS